MCLKVATRTTIEGMHFLTSHNSFLSYFLFLLPQVFFFKSFQFLEKKPCSPLLTFFCFWIKKMEYILGTGTLCGIKIPLTSMFIFLYTLMIFLKISFIYVIDTLLFACSCRISSEHVNIITQTDELVELSFTRSWNFKADHGNSIPLNIDKRYRNS